MSIVLAEQFIIKLHHLHAAYFEAFLFKNADDFAGQSALQGAGLQQDKSLF